MELWEQQTAYLNLLKSQEQFTTKKTDREKQKQKRNTKSFPVSF